MATGFDVNKDALVNAVGGLHVQLRMGFDEALRLEQWFAENNQAAVVALGVDDATATRLRAAALAYAALARVARAQQTVPTANDFTFEGRKLSGLR